MHGCGTQPGEGTTGTRQEGETQRMDLLLTDLPNWLYYVDVNSFLFLQQVELREVMEAEMRTQLRRQAAAHTDHLRDVLKVQEQELQAEAEEVCLLIFDLLVCTRLVKVPFYTSVTPFIILLIPVFPVFAPRKAHETKNVKLMANGIYFVSFACTESASLRM